jgi:regulator of cell morphogenesis and NO signaling
MSTASTARPSENPTLNPAVGPATEAADLIAFIVERFHEGHRSAFPVLLARARELQAAGGPEDLEAQLLDFTQALELHMFKEEMRLFPMMEQGGNTLIGHLIDDLHREHDAHALALAGLQQRLAAAGQGLTTPQLAALQALRQAFDGLAAELREHILAEDERLFLMFQSAAARPATA